MELTFQTSRMPYLKQILHEVRSQEETSETIVPDSYPDIGSIVDSYAEAVLRGKDCRKGSITISGGVKGGTTYLPEDGTWPRNLEYYIPFTMKLENPNLTEQAQVLCSVKIRSVDGRMINSRKAMLRVSVCCQITAYEQAEEPVFQLLDRPDELQVRQSSYAVQLPLETAEKSFVVSDSLELPMGYPPISQLYKQCCRLELTDQKLVANKAVFKGNAVCKLLYFSDDQKLHSFQQSLPFSQYCELRSDYDDEAAEILPVITGYDLELEDQTDTRRGQLTIHVLAQCTILGNKNLLLTEDAFATQGDLNAEWYTYEFSSCLDRQKSVQSVLQHLKGDIREILDIDTYTDIPEVKQGRDTAAVKVPICCHILGYNSAGDLTALEGRAAFEQEWKVSQDVSCVPWSIRECSSYSSLVSDGAEIRCEIAADIMCFGGQPLRCLKQGALESTQERDSQRPSVILRRVERNTPLWELAKKSSAREDAIRTVNHLEGERLQEDRILLIPVG